MDGQPPFVDPLMFESITESTIANSALRTKGSSGPSGLDTDGWKRILVSKNFWTAGHKLRADLAKFARKISTVETEVAVEDGRSYTNLEAYTACRLIPLDKNTGVRPIGVGVVLRRSIGKAILSVIKPDIVSSDRNKKKNSSCSIAKISDKSMKLHQFILSGTWDKYFCLIMLFFFSPKTIIVKLFFSEFHNPGQLVLKPFYISITWNLRVKTCQNSLFSQRDQNSYHSVHNWRLMHCNDNCNE